MADAADDLLDDLALKVPDHRAAVVVFHPQDRDEPADLFSDASAEDLIRVLDDLRARLRGGSLRPAVSGDSVRWVDEGEG